MEASALDSRLGNIDLGNNYEYTIKGASRSALGAIVCRSGGVTGSSCSEVVQLDVTAYDVNGLAKTRPNVSYYCARNGDSGGPIWAREAAYGIHSGSGSDAYGCYGLYQGVIAALDRMNVRLRTVRDP